jgi:hypothetical protein
MNRYTPDSWELVKITGTDPHYRVFGSWSGGYLDGDSWRLNSGIVMVEEEDDYYLFHGHTGSVYQCHKETYGIRSPYNHGILMSCIENPYSNMERIDKIPDIANMKWQLSDKTDEFNSLQINEDEV